ncbi:MAG: ABC transporter substrate-binding protein [Bdellovibrionales bacterium]|nr:ABC transporter substrate-binding protein [Ramlibacter sp.]
MHIRRSILGAAVAAAVIGVLPAHAQQPTIKIGINVERTGGAASYGAHMMIAAQIALDEVNKAGGVNGARLEFITEDNRSSPEQAVIATRNLDRAGVAAMLGPIQTSQCRTAFPAANRAGLVSVSPGSAAPGLTAQNRPWTFRIAAIDTMIVDEVVANLRKAYPNAKTVAIAVDTRDAYNQFLVKTVAPGVVEKHGMTFLNQDQPVEISPDATDFSVFVTKLKAMNPDVLLLGAGFEPAHGFLREANRQKLNIPMFAGQGYITASMATAAGDLNLFAGQPFDPDSSEPNVQKFVAEFKARVDKEIPGQYASPTYIDASAYESIHVLADALRAGKITPATDPKQARESVRTYLAALKGYKGLGNTLNMNAEGDTLKTTMVYRTRAGKWARQ